MHYKNGDRNNYVLLKDGRCFYLQACFSKLPSIENNNTIDSESEEDDQETCDAEYYSSQISSHFDEIELNDLIRDLGLSKAK